MRLQTGTERGAVEGREGSGREARERATWWKGAWAAAARGARRAPDGLGARAFEAEDDGAIRVAHGHDHELQQARSNGA
jgi:hypothetical protein